MQWKGEFGFIRFNLGHLEKKIAEITRFSYFQPECPDGSDETRGLCEEYVCPENSFKCSYGGCIPTDKVAFISNIPHSSALSQLMKLVNV